MNPRYALITGLLTVLAETSPMTAAGVSGDNRKIVLIRIPFP